MKRILVTGAGGSAMTNFVRSLRLTSEEFHIVGTDCDKYHLQRAETDERYLIPLANDKNYVNALNKIIKQTKCEFLHAQNDAEVYYISKYRNDLNIKTFLPRHSVVEKCQDKLRSYELWKQANIKVPLTFRVNTPKDLYKAFKQIKGEVWLRDTKGAGGKGAFKTNRYDFAKFWIDYRNGWGHFTAAECLTPQSTTWLSIWKDGQLVVAQERRRIYWELNGLSMTGVTGATGAGVTANSWQVSKISQQAIMAVDNKPNGIFGVDLTYDKDNIPNPTEINIGRFFTTHYFFANAGLNMAGIFIKLAYGEDISIPKTINPLPTGLVWIRGMDFEPILTNIDTINAYKE